MPRPSAKRNLGLREELTAADEKLKRLSQLVETGIEIDDLLRDRSNGFQAERERAATALDRARTQAMLFVEFDPALLQ